MQKLELGSCNTDKANADSKLDYQLPPFSLTSPTLHIFSYLICSVQFRLVGSWAVTVTKEVKSNYVDPVHGQI